VGHPVYIVYLFGLDDKVNLHVSFRFMNNSMPLNCAMYYRDALYICLFNFSFDFSVNSK